MSRRWSFRILTGLLLTLPLIAQEGNGILLRDGRRLEFPVREVTDTGVVLERDGIRLRVSWPFMETREAVRIWSGHLRPDDAEGRLELGRFCVKRGLRRKGRAFLNEAAEMDARLAPVVAEILGIEEEATGGAPERPPVTGDDEPKGPRPTEEQIFLSDHYRIRGRLSKEELEGLAKMAEGFFRETRQVLGAPRSVRRRDIQFFDDVGSLESYARERGQGLHAGGFYDASRRRIVLSAKQDERERKRTILHLAVHQALDVTFPQEAPPWFEEGLALCWGESGWDGKRIGRPGFHPDADKALEALAGDEEPPALLEATFDAEEGLREPMVAWAVVYFLLYRSEGTRGIIGKVINSLREGTYTPMETVQEAVGDIDTLHMALVKYLREESE